MQITSQVAEDILIKHLHSTPMYNDSDTYRYCLDTHYVESFNHALLLHQDKWIVFGETQYKQRIALAVLDSNEHVDRPATSVKEVQDLTKPRQQQPNKNLSKKAEHFQRQNMECLDGQML